MLTPKNVASCPGSCGKSRAWYPLLVHVQEFTSVNVSVNDHSHMVRSSTEQHTPVHV